MLNDNKTINNKKYRLSILLLMAASTIGGISGCGSNSSVPEVNTEEAQNDQDGTDSGSSDGSTNDEQQNDNDQNDIVIPSAADPKYVVDVNLNINHQKGGNTELDRSKFITMHISSVDNEWPSPEVAKEFIEEYDAYFGRNNGAMPWQLSRLEATAVDGQLSDSQMTIYGDQSKGWYQNSPTFHGLEDRMENMMYGGQEFMYPHKEYNTCTDHCEGNTWIAGYDEYARFFSEFLTKYFGEGGTSGEKKPTIIEVMNEPFVKSSKLKTTNAQLTELHKVVADKIHLDHPEVRVGGFTAAYPALEQNNSNFDLFNGTWKTFIDGAGDVMDFYSIHLYDGHNNSEHQYRSGSNMEAILDMIEHYSVTALGEAKPWVISEHGFYSPHHESLPYSKERDWWNVRSFSSFTMQMMDKPDQIISSMPFIILKAKWYGNNGIDDEGNRYGSRLYVLEEELDGSTNVADSGNWVYSDMVKFYQLWSEVNGKRVDSKAWDFDLQTDAYIDGSTLYLIVNNLESEDVEFSFNLNGKNNETIKSMSAKHVFYNEQLQGAELVESELSTSTSNFNVRAHATAVLKIEFEEDIDVNETLNETKYYADKMKQAIAADQEMTFNLDDVQLGKDHGEAVLRLGLGRLHSKSLKPVVKINDTYLAVTEDFRGYDQKNKDSFFGVIEIPVPYEALKEDNTVTVEFDDAGGFVTSLTMQVFESSIDLER